MIISAMGPKGSYSEKAAKLLIEKYELSDTELHYCDDIEDAILAVVRGISDLSVVPIENSIEGSVSETLDVLLDNKVLIIGEILVKIEHCLLSKGVSEQISVIYSHSQGLAQCRRFLKQNFHDVQRRSADSTSMAAKYASGDETVAAIASPEAAEIYGLKILYPNIHEENYTRFIVLKAEDKALDEPALYSAEAEKKFQSDLDTEQKFEVALENLDLPYKTTFIVYLEKQKRGELFEIIKALATRNINLTMVYARPSMKNFGDYYLYVDFEENVDHEHVKIALNEMEKIADTLRVLGSYRAINQV